MILRKYTNIVPRVSIPPLGQPKLVEFGISIIFKLQSFKPYINSAWRRMDTQRLAVATPDSPGSSVFDLPTQQSISIHLPLNTTSQSQLYLSTTQHATDFTEEPSFIIISGGTGGNAICSAFKDACFVLPVSDDGGSSSEIIRVLGGPSVGAV